MGPQSLCVSPDRNSDLQQSLPVLLQQTLTCCCLCPNTDMPHLHFLQTWRPQKCILLHLTCCSPASYIQVSSLAHNSIAFLEDPNCTECCLDHTYSSFCQKTESGVISALHYWAPGLGNMHLCLRVSSSPLSGHTAGGRLPLGRW